MASPGIEPGSLAWEASIQSSMPIYSTILKKDKNDIKINNDIK